MRAAFFRHAKGLLFGSTGTIQINGLNVPHVEPSEIADNRKIRVVLFKENLSTGWDCPRAETMMSFRHAEDATYIAQLLGRMVRTPLQCHIIVDDSLNDVRLFLPYFNKNTVKNVIDELQSTEGGEIPTVIDGESLEEQVYVPWTVHTRKPKAENPVPGQMTLFTTPEAGENGTPQVYEVPSQYQTAPVTRKEEYHSEQAQPADNPSTEEHIETPIHPQQEPLPVVKTPVNPQPKVENTEVTPAAEQLSFIPMLDRESVTRFINEQGFLTYVVRQVKINSYLKSLLSLAGLLTQSMIYMKANDEVKDEVTDLIRNAFDTLDRQLTSKMNKQVVQLRSILLTESPEAKGEALESTRKSIERYLAEVEYWSHVPEPEMDGQLYYWRIDNWGEQNFGSHGTLFIGAFCNNTKILFPVLLLCDENGEYIDFDELDIVHALESAEDDDIRYFTPADEEAALYERIYRRLTDEMMERYRKSTEPIKAYHRRKIDNWIDIQVEQLALQIRDLSHEVENLLMQEMQARDSLQKADILKKVGEVRKQLQKAQNGLQKRVNKIKEDAEADIVAFDRQFDINPILLVNIVLKF